MAKSTTCPACGGSNREPQGCRACCRDCGFPCDLEKDSEGFHFEAIEEEYLAARRLAEDVDHERVVLEVDDAARCEECGAIKDDPTGFCPNERAVMQRMPIADARADAETLRLNLETLDWIGRVPMLLARGATVTAYEDAIREARDVFVLVPQLRS